MSVIAQSDFLPKGTGALTIFGGHIFGSGNSGTALALVHCSKGMTDVGFSVATSKSWGDDQRTISVFGSQVLVKSDGTAPEALAVDVGVANVNAGGSTTMYLSLGPSVYANLIGNQRLQMLIKAGTAYHFQVGKGSRGRYGYRTGSSFGSFALGVGLIVGSEKIKIRLDLEHGGASGETSSGIFLGLVFVEGHHSSVGSEEWR